MTLTIIDWAVVGVFIAAILTLGFSARLRNSSVIEYLTAGRNLTLPAFVATLVSTWYGGILGVGETVSFYGFGAWLLIGVPFYVFALAYAFWLAPKVRSADQISIPERFHQRWGKGVALLAAALIFLLAVPAAHVLMLGSLVHQLSGLDLRVAVLIGALAGACLLYRGGLLADVRMCLLAFVGMYVGFAITVVYCLTQFPPSQAFQAIENRDLLTFDGGAGWPVILSFFILGAWTFVDPAFHQRTAAAASPETARKGILVSVGFWLLFDLMSITSAMYALALLNPIPEKLAFYPALAERVLPPGLKAMFLCGVLGTIASAMVAYTLVSGATVGREFVARLNPNLPDQVVKSWVRIGFGIALAVAVPVAWTIQSVVDLWYAWAGVVVGALLIPVVMSYAAPGKSRASGTVMLVAIGVASVVSFAWLAYGQRTNNPWLEVVLLRLGDGWRVATAPVPAEILQSATSATTFGVGTVLPGLVISGLIITIGEIVARRNR